MECKKPFYCYNNKCINDKQVGEDCEWVKIGSTCESSNKCYGKCSGQSYIGENCSVLYEGSMCRYPLNATKK